MRVKELIQEARDGMVEQEEESATMKVSEAERSGASRTNFPHLTS